MRCEEKFGPALSLRTRISIRSDSISPPKVSDRAIPRIINGTIEQCAHSFKFSALNTP